jgi:hypothetical protein
VLPRRIEVRRQSKYVNTFTILNTKSREEVRESSYTNILKYAYKACTFDESAFVELGSFESREDILNVSGLATIRKLVCIIDDLYQQKRPS